MIPTKYEKLSLKLIMSTMLIKKLKDLTVAQLTPITPEEVAEVVTAA